MKSSQARLEGFKTKARDQYGTDDLEALRQKLDAMKAENERLRKEYQQHLDAIEADLERIAAEHKSAMNEDQES